MVDSIRRLNQRRNRLFENACRRRLPLQTGAAEKHQTFRLRAADLNETGSGSLFERDRTLRRSEPPDFSHGEVQKGFCYCRRQSHYKAEKSRFD